ncbi:MAG: NapC/NirT family cytochrome c [Planctomycetes bacterium]|nr:NapC/NirT family cytochrome c [Planctomycetota bacterium]
MGRLIERLARHKFKVALGVLGLLTVVGIGSVELTSQSWFCNSCHIMNPYYDSWKVGSHKDVECVKCHISPGADNFVAAKLNGLGQVVDDVLHRTSTKPSASVSQFSCTRSGCHAVEKLQKMQIDNGRFKFQHGKHLGAKHLGVEISCGTCHAHVKGAQHFEVSKSVCITCHMIESAPDKIERTAGKEASVIRMVVRENHPQAPDAPAAAPAPEAGAEKRPPNNCTACHEPPAKEFEYRGLKIDHKQFLAEGAACESCHRGVTATPPPIDDGRCLECHTFGVERAMAPHEMHRVHTEGRHKIECFSCHGAVRHGPQVQTASLEQFDCRQCHIDQHAVQRNTYFNISSDDTPSDGPPTVSPMFLTHVDCTGCHTKPRSLHANPDSGAQVRAAGPEACDACHKAGLGAKMIPLWQKTTHEQHAKLTAALEEAESAGGADAAGLREAKRLLNMIRVDGSWGVHNPNYTQKILEQAKNAISKAKETGGKQ